MSEKRTKNVDVRFQKQKKQGYSHVALPMHYPRVIQQSIFRHPKHSKKMVVNLFYLADDSAKLDSSSIRKGKD